MVYSTVINPHQRKFEPRAVKAVLLGYVSGEKSYKLYDLEYHMIYNSRDVRFYEEIFPFKSSVPSNDDVPLPVPITELEEANDEYSTYDATDGPSDPSEPVIATTILPTQLVVPKPRHSTRQTQPPSWLNDYVTCVVSPYYIISYSSIIVVNGHYNLPGLSSIFVILPTVEHANLLESMTALQELRNYAEASKSSV